MVSEGSEDNTLFIGADHNCSFNVVDPEGRPAPIEAEAAERDGVHAGGAITALQFDGENFHDLLISDVTYPTMSGLMLEDAIDGQDSTVWVDMAFLPSCRTPVKLTALSLKGSLLRIQLTPMQTAIGTWSSPPTSRWKSMATNAFSSGKIREPRTSRCGLWPQITGFKTEQLMSDEVRFPSCTTSTGTATWTSPLATRNAMKASTIPRRP